MVIQKDNIWINIITWDLNHLLIRVSYREAYTLKVSIISAGSHFRDFSTRRELFNLTCSLGGLHDLFPGIDHARTKDLSLTISARRFLRLDRFVTLRTRTWTIVGGKKEFYWQESRYITFRGNSRLLERVSYNTKRWRIVIYGFYRRFFRLTVFVYTIYIYISVWTYVHFHGTWD